MVIRDAFVFDIVRNRGIKFAVSDHVVVIVSNGQRIVYDPSSINWGSAKHQAIIGVLRKLEDAIKATL